MSCADQAPFPRRVNIVCGGKYALVKPERWDCPAGVMPAAQMLASSSARGHHRNKWKVQTNKNYDMQGRPLLCKIRNNCHPRRSLRASTPVMVDNLAWTAEHNWLIEYVDNTKQAGSVSTAFHLCTLQGYPQKAYLTVDEESGKIVMQTAQPSMLWEFYDSSARSNTKIIPGTPISQVSTCDSVENDLEPLSLESEVEVRAPPAEDLAWKLLGIKPFLGNVVDAFHVQQRTVDGKREFTALNRLLSVGTPLGDELELCTGPSTLFGVAVALFGRQSEFRKQLTKRDDADVSLIKPLHGAAWCGVGTSRFKVCVPVLGERPFEEDLRIALACVDGESISLAIQVSSKIALGFPVGDFLTESVHILTQDASGGPVRLRSFGLAPAGRHAEKAIAGMRDSRQAFYDIASSTLAKATVDVLELKLQLAMTDFDVPSDQCLASVPSETCDVDVELASTSASESTEGRAESEQEAWSPWGSISALRRHSMTVGEIILAGTVPQNLTVSAFHTLVARRPFNSLTEWTSSSPITF